MNGWKQQWKKKRMHRMIQEQKKTLRMSWITCRHVKCIYIYVWKSASILPHECERCTRMGCTSASIHYGSWFSFNSRFSAVATQHYIFVAIHQQWIPTETQHRTKKKLKEKWKRTTQDKNNNKKTTPRIISFVDALAVLHSICQSIESNSDCALNPSPNRSVCIKCTVY